MALIISAAEFPRPHHLRSSATLSACLNLSPPSLCLLFLPAPLSSLSVDHDPNRYPSRIAMAECLCTGCVEPSAGAFERSLVSVPVVYRMRALYRRACDPASRLYDYERRWVDVPLACTCVVAKIAPELPAS
ncbi:interleukin-17C-like [Petromyzon marinus]|uniref:Interleukin-17C-like n=1 Tax=Petromyzon marinus TaxID=7757 RepID=A0AAJ7TLS7_PETMA|nr:interleukin-17C-like [Petromyzon marinus]